MNAAIANVWSALAASDRDKSNFFPRFDIRLRQDYWHNREDVNGSWDEAAIELVMSYNLFSGGTDTARRKQRFHEADSARFL